VTFPVPEFEASKGKGFDDVERTK